jgi:hypothetical protein
MAAASCNERAPETHCAKEVQGNFQKMLAEREKQDKMWEQPVSNTKVTENSDQASKNKVR